MKILHLVRIDSYLQINKRPRFTILADFQRSTSHQRDEDQNILRQRGKLSFYFPSRWRNGLLLS